MGKPLVMGRKTFDSIGAPLPGRRHDRRDARSPLGRIPASTSPHDIDAALGAGARERRGRDHHRPAAAKSIAQTIGLADRLYITEVDLAPDGDVRFPAIDPALWRETRRETGRAGPARRSGLRLRRL